MARWQQKQDAFALMRQNEEISRERTDAKSEQDYQDTIEPLRKKGGWGLTGIFGKVGEIGHVSQVFKDFADYLLNRSHTDTHFEIFFFKRLEELQGSTHSPLSMFYDRLPNANPTKGLRSEQILDEMKQILEKYTSKDPRHPMRFAITSHAINDHPKVAIDNIGTMYMIDFAKKLFDAGRIDEKTMKSCKRTRLSSEYATELLNSNLDLFPPAF